MYKFIKFNTINLIIFKFRSNLIKKRFNLPKNSNIDKIEAVVKNGLLTVTIPKNIYKNKIKVK